MSTEYPAYAESLVRNREDLNTEYTKLVEESRRIRERMEDIRRDLRGIEDALVAIKKA